MAETTVTYPRCPKCGATDLRVDCEVVCALDNVDDKGRPVLGEQMSGFGCGDDANTFCAGCEHEGPLSEFIRPPVRGDFVIKNPRCPQCGELADGTLETIHGSALLNINEATGGAYYSGETKVFWDAQTTDLDGDGHPLLVCHNGHDWSMEEEKSDE